MNIKELRKEVQSLRDEIAIMQRKYEDILCNLDTDNFSSRFTKEQGDMRTAIEVTAKGIKTKVSKEELKAYSTIEQTAQHIQNIVSKGAMLDKATPITSIEERTDTSKIYVLQEKNDSGKVVSETYYYFNNITKQWEVLSGDNIYTVFEQTPQGFKIKGNVQIDGSCILTDSLTFDSSDKPLQVEYSVDGVNNWHSTFASETDKFMRLKIGAQWSDPMKIVGTDGKNGKDGQDGFDGSDATVTEEDIFNFLTDGGTTQGLFPVFYDGGNKLYINAAYIKTGKLSADRIDTDNLSCTRLYAKGNDDGYSVRLNGNWGDFGIFTPQASEDALANDYYCMFGVYDSFPNINLYIYGHNFMGLDVDSETIWAKGDWNFSACDNVKGLDKFVTGGSGTNYAEFK